MDVKVTAEYAKEARGVLDSIQNLEDTTRRALQQLVAAFDEGRSMSGHMHAIACEFLDQRAGRK